MNQLDLLSWRPPAQRHSDTSRAAADAIAPKAGTLRAVVLAFIKSQGAFGATDEEISLALDMAGNTVRPRRRELQQAGLVVDSGRRRPTESRRLAVVWIAREGAA